MENAQELKVKIDDIVQNGKKFWEIESPGTYYVLDTMFMKAQIWHVEEANRINIKYWSQAEAGLKSVPRKMIKSRTYYFSQEEFERLEQLVAALEFSKAVEAKCLNLLSSSATKNTIKRLSLSEQMQLIRLLDPHWNEEQNSHKLKEN